MGLPARNSLRRGKAGWGGKGLAAAGRAPLNPPTDTKTRRTSGAAMVPRMATAETMRERTRMVEVVGGGGIGRLWVEVPEMAGENGEEGGGKRRWQACVGGGWGKERGEHVSRQGGVGLVCARWRRARGGGHVCHGCAPCREGEQRPCVRNADAAA